MKDNLGYIRETMLNYFNEDNNSQNSLDIDNENIIEQDNVDNNFEYNQSSQENQLEEDFDYTLLKVIVFLIFL